MLNKQHASTAESPRSRQLQSTVDLAAAQAAFGEKWKPDSMFTIVIGSDGKVLYRKEGLIVREGGFPEFAG